MSVENLSSASEITAAMAAKLGMTAIPTSLNRIQVRNDGHPRINGRCRKFDGDKLTRKSSLFSEREKVFFAAVAKRLTEVHQITKPEIEELFREHWTDLDFVNKLLGDSENDLTPCQAFVLGSKQFEFKKSDQKVKFGF